jgi:hypothetical protein
MYILKNKVKFYFYIYKKNTKKEINMGKHRRMSEFFYRTGVDEDQFVIVSVQPDGSMIVSNNGGYFIMTMTTTDPMPVSGDVDLNLSDWLMDFNENDFVNSDFN